MGVLTGSPVKLTYDDYLLLPDDNNIHEIIDGEHYMAPSPSTYHQTVSRRLQFLLYDAIELTGAGVVFDAPTDVQFSDYDVVVPDIFVIQADLYAHSIRYHAGSIDVTVDLQRVW